MNEDMSQFMGVFLEEAHEQIHLLEKDLLILEKSPAPNTLQTILQEIFRAAHTLKGSSRSMGFVPMGELTHAMEDVFESLRLNKTTVSRALIDALLAALDALKAMMEDIAATGGTERGTTHETALLRSVIMDQNVNAQNAFLPHSVSEEDGRTQYGFAIALSEAAYEAAREASSEGYNIFVLHLEVAPDCVMKSVRALMTLQTLETIGSPLASFPDEDGLENEAFETAFEVVVATEADADAVTAAVANVNEVRCERIAVWEMFTQAEKNTEAAQTEFHAATAVKPGADTTEYNEYKTNPSESEEQTQSSEDADSLPVPAGALPSEPAPSTGAGPHETPGARTKTPAATVRVDVARLDRLLDLVGELVIDRTRMARLEQRFEREHAGGALLESLSETATHIGRITDALQDEIMKARMMPVDSVFNRFPRMMRDLAQRLGKELHFEMEGQETELDRTVIEMIGDPLIHMLRNSADHGIEMPDEREKAGKPRMGTVHLRARHQENSIVIEIQDDGRGMDAAKLRESAVRKSSSRQTRPRA